MVIDIRERFRSLDSLEFPGIESPRPGRDTKSSAQPSASRRLLAAGVALVIAAASFFLLIEAFRRGTVAPAIPPSPASTKTGLPSGTIAFAGGSGSLPRIVTISSDGTNEVELSPASLAGPGSPYPAQQPAWSPDGRFIAFSGTWGGPGELKRDLYVMNADGSGLSRLTYGMSAGSPSWSPSAAYLAFVDQRTGELYRVRFDTGQTQRIAPASVRASDPVYSPDGSMIAFSARTADGQPQIFLIRAAGSRAGLTQLTSGSEDAVAPAWSPDGTQIVYEGQAQVQSNLYIMNSDGSRQRLLAGCGASACYFTHPSWSPDGQWIIYDCNESLCAVKPNGADMHVAIHVKPGAIGFTTPAWRPGGGSVSQAAPTPSAVPVERIICMNGRTVVASSVVQADVAGVHFVIENKDGAWGVDLHHDSWAYGTSESVQLRGRLTNDTSAMGPGRVTVGCLPTGQSAYFSKEVHTASLTIVDPNGLYVSPDLACGSGDQFQMKIGAGSSEDPKVVFHRVPGILPSDVFAVPNYPKSPHMWPTFVVFRGGKPIARIQGPYNAGEWKIYVDSCPSSGIHP